MVTTHIQMTTDDSFDSLFLQQKQYQVSAQGQDQDKDQLLTYYRSRLDLFEREREEWLEKLESTRVKQEEVHKQSWELKGRCDEVRTLQQQLSDLQVVLLNEREQIAKLARENDTLQLQGQESQRKIAELLSIVHPIQQEVTFFQDKRPQSVLSYPQSASLASLPAQRTAQYCGTCKNTSEVTGRVNEKHTTRLGRTTSTPKHVIKTVYLPNEQMNTLALEVDTLRKQLDQEHALHSSALQALQEDRRIREHEFRLNMDAAAEKTAALTQSLAKEESSHTEAVKDYLRLRHQSQIRERTLIEKTQELENKVDSLLSQLRHTRVKTASEIKEAERVAEEKAKDFTHKFRSEAVDNEESMQVMREQYMQLQGIYKEKVSELEGKLVRLQQRYRDLEERKGLEVAGYKQEVQTLRKVTGQLKEAHEIDREEARSRPSTRKAVGRKVCDRCRERYGISQSPERNDNSWKD